MSGDDWDDWESWEPGMGPRVMGRDDCDRGPGMVNGHYRQRGDGTPVKSLDQAQGRAQKWLHDRGSGLTADEAEAFPGYHTLHTLRSGKIVGMPSANASTGTVWGHTWHGTHVATSEH